jgi:hypothetical protein
VVSEEPETSSLAKERRDEKGYGPQTRHNIQNSQNFSGLFHRPLFQKTRRFGNWIRFRPQVKEGENAPTQLSPLERANLNHWTPKNTTFRKLDLFPSSGEGGGEDTYSVGPLRES